MRRTKEQKGITLIALIITIVVLLILAVVAINSIDNYGIMSHAGNTANTYNQAVKNEQQHLDNYLSYLDKVQGELNGGSKTYKTYTVGQEVKLKNTSKETGTFYVIENSDEKNDTVLILTRECIDTTNLVQSDTSSSNIKFSTDLNYLSTIEGALSENEEPDSSLSAAHAAYRYAKETVGGTFGRLISLNEARALLVSHKDMICETTDYWVGHLNGYNGLYYDAFYIATSVICNALTSNVESTRGVRPVVEISKSLVELVEPITAE